MRNLLPILLFLAFAVFAVALPAQETDKPKEAEASTSTANPTPTASPEGLDDHVVPKTSAEALKKLEEVKKSRAEIPDTDETKKELRDVYDAQIVKLTELAKVLLELENFDADLKKLQDQKKAVDAAEVEEAEKKPPLYVYKNVSEQKEIEANQLLNTLQQEKATATTALESRRQSKLSLTEEIATLTASITAKATAEAEADEALKQALLGAGGESFLLAEKLYLAQLDKEVLIQRKARAEREQATSRRQLQENIAEAQERIAKLKVTAQMAVRDAIKTALAAQAGFDGQEKLDLMISDRERTVAGSPSYEYMTLQIEAIRLSLAANQATNEFFELKERLSDTGEYESLKVDAQELQTWIKAEQDSTSESEGLLPESAADIRTYLAESRSRFAGATKAIQLLRESTSESKKLQSKIKSAKTRAPAKVRLAQERAKGYQGTNTVPTTEQWQSLTTDLETTLGTALTKVTTDVDDKSTLLSKWSELQDIADGNIAFLKQRLRWTREKSSISIESIQTAFRDGADAVENVPSTVTSLGPLALDYLKNPGRRIRVVVVGVLFIALGFLFWRLRKRLPTTYHWIEEQSKEGNQFFKVLGIFLRRTDLSLLLALLFIGAPWAAGMDWVVVAASLCVFGVPFLYRLGRVTLDVFFQPGSNDIRFFDMDEKLAEIIHRAGRWMLNLALFFLPIGYLLEIFGYQESNPGFLQLWWLVYGTLTQLVLLFSIFRPVVVRSLIRGQNIVAVSLKAWILLGYPLLVTSTLFIFLLGSLRYSEAKSFFQILLFKTMALLLGSYLLYRIALRALLKAREIDHRLLADEFENEDAYLAAGRQQFADRLVRTILRFAVTIPVVVMLFRFWDEVSFDWAHASMDGGEGISLYNLLQALLVVFVTMVFVTKLRGALNFVILPNTKLDRGLRYTVIMLTTYGSWTIGIVIALQIIRVSGDNIAFFTGALAFGIGFGLQSIVKNFVSGLILLVERPVKVGDMVEVESRSGTVDKITLRATTVMTYDGIGVVIPNELMIGGSLTNYSLGHPRLRSTLAVGVGYGSDVQKVRKLLNEVVSNHGLILKRPEPEAFFIGFGDSSLDFQILFWTSMTTHRPRTLSDLRFALNAAFKREGVEIPFPQRDLNIRTVDGTVVAAFGGAKLPAKGDGGAMDIDNARNQDATPKSSPDE